MTDHGARAAARSRARAREAADEALASPLERLLERSVLETRPAAPAPPVAPVGERRGDWRRRYAAATVAADATLLAAASATAYMLRFGSSGGSVGGLSYLAITVITVPAWLAFLAAGRCYEHRFLGVGAEELRRVFNGSIRLVAAAALLGFATGVRISRVYGVVALLLGVGLLLLERLIAHRVLRRLRAIGRCVTRVVAVGDRKRIVELATQAAHEADSGFTVVGACMPLGDVGGTVPGTDVPILGSLTGIVRAAQQVGADTVAVTASAGINAATLRRLGWELEGTGVSLVVAPGLTDVAGPRIQVRPVGSRLPLLEVDEPEMTGARQVLKGVQDRLIASALLAFLAPLLLVLAVVVRLDSPGPALFRQVRIGRDGRPFRLFKYRSMVVDAEARLDTIIDLNEGEGVLFKVRADPRVTRAGRWLRRLSLDELPQLLNVLAGQMALVGPRPPLPAEVEKYADDVRRRLLVKPGITGLWQVGGRSDLSWEDSVRLDLYYVENWSLALDLSIIARTVRAVVRGRGAY